MDFKPLKKILSGKYILLIILFALLLRLPWLYTTIERDEGIFAYRSWRMLEGETMYEELTANKPPLIYLTYASVIKFFGNDIIPIRMLNNVLFLLSIFFLYKAIKNLLDEEIALYSSLFYSALMNIPVMEGQLAMTEPFVVYFIILSLYFLGGYYKGNNKLWLPALFFGYVAFLYKYTALFMPFFVSLVILYKERERAIKKLALGNLTLILFSLSLFFILMKRIDFGLLWLVFSRLVLAGHIMHLGLKLNPGMIYFIILETLPFLMLLAISLFNIRELTKKMPMMKSIFIFLLLSLIFSALPPFFGHYFLQAVPAVSFVSAYCFLKLKKVDTAAMKFLLILSIAISVFFTFQHYPDMHASHSGFNIRYSDYDSYQDQSIISDFIQDNTGKEDYVGLLGWSGELHFLAGRKMPDTYSQGQNCRDLKFSDRQGIYIEYPIIPTGENIRLALEQGADNREYVQANSTMLKEFLLGGQPKKTKMLLINPAYAEECNTAMEGNIISEFSGWERKEVEGILIYIRP